MESYETSQISKVRKEQTVHESHLYSNNALLKGFCSTPGELQYKIHKDNIGLVNLGQEKEFSPGQSMTLNNHTRKIPSVHLS